MSIERLITVIAVMAVVTYLPRVLPIAILRRKIKNRFLNSFLTYMPYGVLAAMVFPSVLFSTGSVLSAAIGLVVALLLSWRKTGLFPVALFSTLAVFITERIMELLI